MSPALPSCLSCAPDVAPRSLQTGFTDKHSKKVPQRVRRLAFWERWSPAQRAGSVRPTPLPLNTDARRPSPLPGVSRAHLRAGFPPQRLARGDSRSPRSSPSGGVSRNEWVALLSCPFGGSQRCSNNLGKAASAELNGEMATSSPAQRRQEMSQFPC